MPGEGYVSVGELYRNKKNIRFKDWEKTLATCFHNQVNCTTPKYSIVRVIGDKMKKAIILAKKAGLNSVGIALVKDGSIQ